jgi:hypothetical protein
MRVDSASYHPERDTLSTAAISTARACRGHFTLAQTAAADLLDLAHLALITGDSALTRQAADRYVTAIPGATQRRWALFAVDTMYFNAKPIRLAEAEATALRLDSLGAPAAPQRAEAYRLLRGYAEQRYDVPRLERDAVAEVHACLQLSKADQDAGAGCTLSEVAADLLYTELYKDPQMALAHTEQLLKGVGLRDADWKAFGMALHMARLDWAMAQIGKPVPPLQTLATPQPVHWVGAGADSAQHVWPVPGKVSIYLRGSSTLDAPENMALWRRLGAKYGSQLSLTIQVAARGSFHDGPPLTPVEEAARLATFYRKQLGVPATVVVAEPAIEQLPPPDGRIIRGEVAFEKDPFYQSAFLLVDRSGKLLLGFPMGAPKEEESMLDAWLARAVGR